jgi:hypothetical protein
MMFLDRAGGAGEAACSSHDAPSQMPEFWKARAAAAGEPSGQP